MFRRLYYDKQTGNVVLNYSFKEGSFTIPTIQQDFNSYTDLKNKDVDTIGCKEFKNGEYEQDFAECNGYRVNPTTLGLEFSYPDPNSPTEEQVINYQKPLTEQISELTNTVDLILTEIIPSLMA